MYILRLFRVKVVRVLTGVHRRVCFGGMSARLPSAIRVWVYGPTTILAARRRYAPCGMDPERLKRAYRYMDAIIIGMGSLDGLHIRYIILFCAACTLPILAV